MASKKSEAALLKAKEAKQKKILLLLIPVLLVLVGWQGPKTYKSLTGGNTPPATAAPAVTTAPTPGSAPSTPGAGAVGPDGRLVDTDKPPPALEGQLTNFSVFPGRDPFSGGTSTTTSPTSTESSGTTPTVTPTSARLEVNGQSQKVSIGGTFPESDPVFKLVSVTLGSAVVGLASGANFTDGQPSYEIKVGESLIVTGDDGSSFTIKILSVGSD